MKNIFIICLLVPVLSLSQTQIGQDIDGEAMFDDSGWSISLSSDGSIIAIGAPGNDGTTGNHTGHVRVYENIGGIWFQIGVDIDGEAATNELGYSVSISSNGSIIAIGESGYNGSVGFNTGRVRVFENITGDWTQLGADIEGDVENGFFGDNVSLSSNGSIVAISYSGVSVKVFSIQSNNWVQIGENIDNEGNLNYIGNISLSSNGLIIAIGAYGNDGVSGVDSGLAIVYENITGVWTQLGQDIEGEGESDLFGYDISISSNGTVLAVGAINGTNELGQQYGNVRVFDYVGGIWMQIGENIIGESTDHLGHSVSLSSDGTIIAIGGPLHNSTDSGFVQIYKNINNVWTQLGNDINGEGSLDQSGYSVSLSSSGDTVAIGAPYNAAGNPPGSAYGHVRVYDLSAVLSSDDYALSQFSIYPNPAKRHFIVELNNNLELEIINIYNNLSQFVNSTSKHVVDTSNFSSGIYYVEVITNKGKSIKKLVIE